MSAERAPPVHYETVAASQTAQVLGSADASNVRDQEFLARVVIIPTTTSPASVTIIDNATSIVIFNGGASSLTTLAPIVVELGINSQGGPWKITTGANVAAIGIGRFK